MNKKNIVGNFFVIFFMVLSYLIIDLGIRFISYSSYNFYDYTSLAPLLFSLGWISLFVGGFYIIPFRFRRIYYSLMILFFNVIGYSQYMHFKILNRFYGINDLFLTKEGSTYFKYVFYSTDYKIILIILFSFVFSIFSLKFSKKFFESYRDKTFILFVIIFSMFCCFSFILCGYFRLGKDEDSSSYAAAISGLSVYTDFNNPNKNMQVVGLYENLPRGFYVYFREKFKNKNEYINKVEEYLKNNKREIQENEYTGIFKDKNVIFILMESIDKNFVTEEYMPTLYKLQSEGINFVNRYSPVFGGGATINSEFAVNTGLYASTEFNIYNLDNVYSASLANKFKEKSYSVDSIHYNHGYYYNRSDFHKRLGFDNHYSLLDLTNVNNKKYDYGLDSNLIKSNVVYDYIVRDDKFLSFITTYSAHLPYDNNERCVVNKYDLKSYDMELNCILNMVFDTDEMIRLLIDRLRDDNKLDDTILIFASDHYMYGYNNIDEISSVHNKFLLQNTPFVIWGSDIKHTDVTRLVDTADILPTVLNMFDIEYDPSLYVGEDAFFDGRDEWVCVAIDNDNIIAFLSIEVHHEEEEYIYLDDLSVTSSYRNNGIGTSLIKRAEEYAEKIRVSKIYFHVEKTNASAFRLYQRLGYSIKEEQGTRYLMSKEL